MQVAGRAGRCGDRGEVLIQTRFPEEPLFAALAAQDYPMFADETLEERRESGCVPGKAAPTLPLCVLFLFREAKCQH